MNTLMMTMDQYGGWWTDDDDDAIATALIERNLSA